jgi:NitT/TauT family transport system substrate-binding protein
VSVIESIALHRSTARNQVNRTPRALLGTLLAVGVLTAACGGDDDSSQANGQNENGAGEELTPITVGILPLSGLAPVWYGVDKGYFADEGLDVTLKVGGGGAELAPAVLNNDYQFAVGEYVSLMQARENNVKLQVVSNLTNGADAPDQGINALLVAPDSDIKSVKDLAGKTIAVNGLGGIDDIAVRAILDKHGVDSSSVHFTEIDFPDMNAAVKSGQVDVAAQPEPFVTLGEKDGLVNLLDPYYETLPGMPLGLVFASEKWLKDNPDLANAFDRALKRSIEASSDKEAMQQAILANTDTEADLLQDMALDHWDAKIDRAKLRTLGQLATKYGVLKKEPDLDKLIWTPS